MGTITMRARTQQGSQRQWAPVRWAMSTALVIVAAALIAIAVPSTSAQTPPNAEVLIEVAEALVKIGEFDQAVGYLWEAVHWDPGCDECLKRLAEVLAAWFDHDEAELAYERGVRELSVGRVPAAVEYFVAVLGDEQQVLDLLAVAMDPTAFEDDRTAAYIALGKQFQALALLDAAAAQYETAMRIRPDDPAASTALRELRQVQAEAYFNAGDGLRCIGRYQEARAYFAQALLIRPDHSASREALDALPPTEAEAHFRVGRVYESRGLYEEAREQYAAALIADPNHEQARQALQSIPVERGVRGLLPPRVWSALEDILINVPVSVLRLLVVPILFAVGVRWVWQQRVHYRVVVDAFENGTGREALDVGHGLAQAARVQLSRHGLQIGEVAAGPMLPELLAAVEMPQAQLVGRILSAVLPPWGVRVTGALRIVSRKGNDTLCASIQVADLASGRVIDACTVRASHPGVSTAALDDLAEKVGDQLYYSSRGIIPRRWRSTKDEASFRYFMEGLKHHRAKELKKAIEAYSNAVAIDPANALAHLNLGMIRFGEARKAGKAKTEDAFGPAIDSYCQAEKHIESIPRKRHFRVYLEWGQALLEGLEDFEEAIKRLDTALEKARESKQPVEMRWEIELFRAQALIHLAQAKRDQSDQIRQRLEEDISGPKVCALLLAWRLRKLASQAQGAEDRAWRIVDAIERRGTRNPRLLYQLASAQAELKAFAQAATNLGAAIRREPESWFGDVMHEAWKPLRMNAAWWGVLCGLLRDGKVQLNVNQAIEEELACAFGLGPACRVIQARNAATDQLTMSQFWGAAQLTFTERQECKKAVGQLNINEASVDEFARAFGAGPARRVVQTRNAARSQKFAKMEQVWKAARLPRARRCECEDKVVIEGVSG